MNRTLCLWSGAVVGLAAVVACSISYAQTKEWELLAAAVFACFTSIIEFISVREFDLQLSRPQQMSAAIYLILTTALFLTAAGMQH